MILSIKMYRCLYHCLFFFLSCVYCTAQPIIHSHNDYAHALPFWDAYNNNAGVIEADVYAVNDTLMVAHNKKDIKPPNTLSAMYIEPVTKLFNSHKTQGDSVHTFYLMIDIKENADTVLKLLMHLLQQHPYAFNRLVNPKAVQVFISGERPADSMFHSFPSYIMFDGLPRKKYAPADLKKIVMISDNFETYSKWDGINKLPATDSLRIINVIREAHAEGKKIRLWGAPDTQQCWLTLMHMGIDVINTDKVKECRAFLDRTKTK